jgi:hypothetical protein
VRTRRDTERRRKVGSDALCTAYRCAACVRKIDAQGERWEEGACIWWWTPQRNTTRACATANSTCSAHREPAVRKAQELSRTHPSELHPQRIAAMGKPGEKQWLPLESNPEVMDAYVRG